MFEGAVIGNISTDMEDCALFTFVAEFCLMGMICLFGIGGNTAACAVLWHEISVTAPLFLLQAALIADIATVWILFIAEGIPALEYITDALQDCMLICRYVTIITRPLLFLAQFASAWFIVLALYGRYIIMCKPSQTDLAMSLGRARKQAVTVIVVGLFLTLPLTFDSAISVGTNKVLIDNYWYRTIYLYIILFLAATLIPMILAAYFCVRLALVVRSVHHLRRVLVPAYRLENLDMTQVMLGMGITLIICYLPQLALCMTQMININAIQTHCGTLHYYLNTLCNLFISINAASKVIILCTLTRKFQSKLKKRFCLTKDNEKEDNVYHCRPMSEMTLISHMECSPTETQAAVEDNPVIRLLAATSNCKEYNTDEY